MRDPIELARVLQASPMSRRYLLQRAALLAMGIVAARFPAGSRAVQLWTHRSKSMFLDTFGRPNENQDPPCERIPDSTVTQSLHLMNDREIDSRIRNKSGRATQLASRQKSGAEIAEELYLAAFSRFPEPDENSFPPLYHAPYRAPAATGL
jgi:hypothetical protein